MTKEKDIAYLGNIYSAFVNEANSKIKAFWESRYETFDKDVGDEGWVKKSFVQKNLEEIKKFYRFVRLIEEVYNSDFIDKICEFAGKYGFRKHPSIFESYGNRAMLAIDLALHFPLWDRETYGYLDFTALGFRREKSMEGFDHFLETGVVPILRITVGKERNLKSIEVYPWSVIRAGLFTIFKE